MTTRTRSVARLLALAILLTAAAFTGAVRAQAPGADPLKTAPLGDPMPVDPFLKMGTLPNGLRYYVRPNNKPEKRAELRLVVRAGSVLEEDDQRGMAHIVEHMAFNGTQHFPGNDIIGFMQGLGMKFGAHVNAYTSFDETVYKLQVPTDRQGVMARAMQALEDWAYAVSFDPLEVEKERGVVLEEWRMRRGVEARMQDQQLPVLLAGSRYPDRVPIGTTDIIQNGKIERLRQFYKDWYRPDLMAVIAVGDFEPDPVVDLIKARFSGLTNPPNEKPRPTYDIPEHAGTVYLINTDRELTNTTVEISTLLPAHKQGTIGVYRDEIVDRLFSSLLSARLSDIGQKPDAPFLDAGVDRSLFFARTRDQATIGALVKDDGIEKGLEALIGEIERVAKFGFTPAEVTREKQNVLRAYERIVAEKESRESSSRADEYIRNFMENETLPTVDEEYRLHQRFLPEITADEVNKLARVWFPENNRTIIVNAPDKPTVKVPDKARLEAAVKSGATKNMTAYADNAAAVPLMTAAPKGGTIAKTTVKDAIGITEWELSNGAKVVLKPTTFNQDEVLFRAVANGGTSLASDADFIPASTAAQLVSAGGLGAMDSTALRRALTGKVAGARPYIGDYDQGVTGSSSRKDLETMFQLVYLTFTAPRADRTAFGVQQTQARSILASQSASPDFAFVEALTNALSMNNLRRKLPDAASVDQWNLDKSFSFYKARFADASAFTFVLVGDFDLNTVKPLVEKYLGALPSTRGKETWKDVGIRTVKGVVQKDVRKGIEPKSEVGLVFTGTFPNDPAHRTLIRAVVQSLQARLVESLREELGGTYSVSANQTFQRIPNNEYSITVQFGCDPARTNDLVKRVFQEIDGLKASGPSQTLTRDVQAAMLREFETSSLQNGYVIGQIVSKYQNGEDPSTIWDLPAVVRSLTREGIRQAAIEYLNTNNYVQVALFPEKK